MTSKEEGLNVTFKELLDIEPTLPVKSSKIYTVFGKFNFLGSVLKSMNPEDRRKIVIKGDVLEVWCPSGDKLASFLKLDPKDFSIRKKEEK